MAETTKLKELLEKKYKKVIDTPPSFAFFVAIHDFVDHIESSARLSSSLSRRAKATRDAGIPNKYEYLKEIHQGVKDVTKKSVGDIGHTRYIVVRDLSRIQNNETSENNSFWKKRELFRKLTGEVYKWLNV